MQNGQMKGQVGHSLPLPGLSGVANGPVGKCLHAIVIFGRQSLTNTVQVTSSRAPSTKMATSRLPR